VSLRRWAGYWLDLARLMAGTNSEFLRWIWRRGQSGTGAFGTCLDRTEFNNAVSLEGGPSGGGGVSLPRGSGYWLGERLDLTAGCKGGSGGGGGVARPLEHPPPGTKLTATRFFFFFVITLK